MTTGELNIGGFYHRAPVRGKGLAIFPSWHIFWLTDSLTRPLLEAFDVHW